MLSLKLLLQNRQYFVVAFFFVGFSMVFSTWVVYIPYMFEKLQITEAQYGAARIFSTIGAIGIIPIITILVRRYRIGKMVMTSYTSLCLSVLLLVMSGKYWHMCASFFMLGASTSALVIMVNNLIAAIEKRDSVIIMSACHGFWSFTGLLGALSGSFIAARLNNPVLHLILLVSVLIGVQLYQRKYYYFLKGNPVTRKFTLRISSKALIIISIIGVLVMVSEGAIADWSALYLKKVVHSRPEHFGFAYAAFSLSMAFGRFLGDYVSGKIGSFTMLMYSMLISVVGYLLILTTRQMLVFTGFAVVGLGFSVVVPEVFRVAANIKNIDASIGISFVTTVAQFGYLAGPALLGFIADKSSLKTSFFVLFCFTITGFVFTWATKRIKP